MALAVPALVVQTGVLARPGVRGPPPQGGGRPQLRQAEVDRRFEAWLATANDREAAEVLGVQLVAFRTWRRRAGLPGKRAKTKAPTRVGGPRITPEVEARRREVFAVARSDHEAARVLGVSLQAFYRWRVSRGILPKVPSSRTSGAGASVLMFCPVDGSLLRDRTCSRCGPADAVPRGR